MNASAIVSGSAFKDDKGNIYHIIEAQLVKKVSGYKGQIKYTTIKPDNTMKNSRQSIETFKDKLSTFTQISMNELAKRYDDIADREIIEEAFSQNN